MKMRKLFGIILSLVLCIAIMPASSITAATVLTENKTGTEDGYDYELWKDSGNTTMTLTGNGSFTCQWSNINNALFRTGKKFNSTQTYQEIGNITVDYAVDYKPSGNSYLCLYGWTKDPLVEYYIVESWGSWRPPGATSKGTITVDGGTYDVYETTRVNQPSIIGNTTFQQYWSVRTSKRTSGTISVNEHFAAWEKMGMKMGKMYEAALTVEGYQSSGSATVSKNIITIGGSGTTQPDPEPEPIQPDANGYYFHSTYENGNDNWSSRGNSTVASSGNAVYAGNKSLYVSGRTDAWNGAGYTLDTAAFKPGSSYSFSTVVMQNTQSAVDFKLSLQYDLNGETNYASVAETTGSKGKWIQLANTNYTIPAGASNLLLYVETLEGLTDFYVDEAIGAKAGTVIKVEIPVDSGDVNSDGSVNQADLEVLKNYILGKGTTVNADAADLDGSKTIDSVDMAALRALIVWHSQQPVEPPTEPPTQAPPVVEGQWYNTADISWIDLSKPMVALTFDDGPVGNKSTDTSIRIQNALANNGFHATFFYCPKLGGRQFNAACEEEIVRAHELGFEVANHTYSHPDLKNQSADFVKKQVNDCKDILSRLTGRSNFLLRPPYLSVDANVQANVGAPIINCAVDSLDWNNATSQQMIDNITSKMRDGSLDNCIVLMHETYTTTADAVEYLLPYMKQQGWQVVTVSELFKANGKEMRDGQVYTKAS